MNQAALKTIAIPLLAASLVGNYLLFQRGENLRKERDNLQAMTAEMESLRQQAAAAKRLPAVTQELESLRRDKQELIRLRNEVNQRRSQTTELEALRAQVAQLQNQLAQSRQALVAQQSNLAAQQQAAVAQADASADERIQAAEVEAKSFQCVNNLKRIGIAARLFATNHDGLFPPDFLTMHQELASPTYLVCPGDDTKALVTEWDQFNPAGASYQWLLPNADASGDPNRALCTCTVHGHTVSADGQARKGQ